MKRIFLILTLMSMTISASFAAQQSQDKTDKVKLKWHITIPGNYIDYHNQSSYSLSFHMKVKDSFYVNGKRVKSDRVTMYCGNNKLTLRPHMLYVCDVAVGHHLKLVVEEKDFHNGAKGKGWYY